MSELANNEEFFGYKEREFSGFLEDLPFFRLIRSLSAI